MAETAPPAKRRSVTVHPILLGLLAGIACGLLFGDLNESLKWLGDAYVGLLQMAVLPYVTASLVAKIGRLSPGGGSQLMRNGMMAMGALWIIGLVTFMIMTQSFPKWDAGSFFSSRFTEQVANPNWMDLFIPSNPFRSLADNSIPAVVVFCIGVGIALIGLPNKHRLLDPLDVLVDALANLNRLVVKLTPVGIFAISAYATGTIDLNQFSLIQGYLLTYCGGAIIITFVVLPALICSVVPIDYRTIVRVMRDPLVAVFVIGNSFVVLPMLIESIKRLERESGIGNRSDGRSAGYLVPLAYPFPDIGRIIGLIFIPFAAWFYGSTIHWDTYPALLAAGLPGAFAKPVIAIPLLLDLAELPSDIINLWFASGVVAMRFGDLMKTMHLFTFAILAISFANRSFRFQPKTLLVSMLMSATILAGVTLTIREYLDHEFKGHYEKRQLITERVMKFPDENVLSETATVVMDHSAPHPVPIAAGQTRVQRIQQQGEIRIGFDPSKMPFCYYRGSNGKLTGFDVQMAYYLAHDLGVDLCFVPIDPGNLHQQLKDDHFDVAMSALEGSVKQAALIPSTDAYMEVTLAIVVPDHAKADYRSIEQIRSRHDLKLAVIAESYFAERARSVLSNQLEVVEIESPEEYFQGLYHDVGGLVTSAESGSAWTMREPQFTVANPLKGRVRVPLYYMTSGEREFDKFLQNWLTLKRSNGTYQELYDYWILGLDGESKPPRWCVIRDVLGWIE